MGSTAGHYAVDRSVATEARLDITLRVDIVAVDLPAKITACGRSGQVQLIRHKRGNNAINAK